MPKEHFTNIYDLDSETAGKIFILATLISRALKKVLKCDGLNVVQNNEVIAGQSVLHFHMHLIPRYKGDGLNLLAEQKPGDMEEIAKIRDLLRGELQ